VVVILYTFLHFNRVSNGGKREKVQEEVEKISQNSSVFKNSLSKVLVVEIKCIYIRFALIFGIVLCHMNI